MSKLRPFAALRPGREDAPDVASLPYDVMNRSEAKEMAEGNPKSYLHIVRSEISLPDSVGAYEDEVYEKASENLKRFEEEGILTQDTAPHLYIYALTMDGRTQRGIVGCASIDEYLDGTIKKHEFTREVKEIDRIRHFAACSAHTEPIFLAYRSSSEVKAIVDQVVSLEPTADFVSEDGIGHACWVVPKELEEKLVELFGQMEAVYIADGHHRSASSAKVGLQRRQENPGYTGEEEFNFFLSVFFDEDELKIMDYNRVVKDLWGLSEEEFLQKVEEDFLLEKYDAPVRPTQPGTFGMYLKDQWYLLRLKEEKKQGKDVISGLDVSLLQDHLLSPILGIDDPRTSERIDFVGGIRGLEELERRVHSDMKVAFSLHPTSMHELLDVADAGQTMPPKSTWFEPKLRSGLFVHKF